MPTFKIADLPPRVPERPIIIVDPGKRTGACVVKPVVRQVPSIHTGGLVPEPGTLWEVADFDLDDLPFWLATACALHEPEFIGVEDYSMTGGNRSNDPKMPSAIGIGMVRAVGMFAETRVVLLPRGVKRAGRLALDANGKAAYALCRNDHRRDVVALGGYCLRELRAAEHNAALRA